MALISEAALDELKRRNPCDELAGKWVNLRRSGGKMVGPCPICSPNQLSRNAARFEVTADRWVCAVCEDGGDVIRLVERVEGKDFHGAVEWLGGAQEPDPEVTARRAREREDRKAKTDAASADYREKERARLHRIWEHGEPLTGSLAADYLAGRGIEAPPGARLRCHPEMFYFHGETTDETGRRSARMIHKGPAMVAAIVGPDGRFAGIHITYLDAGTAKKAVIIDPDTGEILPAKKVRGSKRGGYIHLGGDLTTAKRLDIGEGIETVLSVRQALARDGRDLSGHLFWSSIDLGNLGGKATETVPHPTLTWRNALGHIRRQRLPGPVPDLDEPSIPVPDRIDEVTLLGDGDSDRELTKNALLRAARRFRRPGRAIRMAWADAGKDFNDMWIEEMAG
ncbi:DUF7146 domain-containing protein [Chelatococcus asaccharovorans]|uniref:DUF7146 domain-containing protein n=1 Tax=Chelatococcus asaccharovorans TaxID=28210 RepID=UPI00224C6C2F|nr:CHC2 zinc finger domain-containing protein [Chelatococcus asaccharovorans]CAH1671917.1 CHC2 zinc finger [Chelatococcus asaccharovorans]CAH1676676.1 CHC2 zinc finger [Chelatococcus asaccharovorans]